MSLGCARCGSCCAKITCDAAHKFDEWEGDWIAAQIDDIEFIRAHWHPHPDGDGTWTCDMYDAVHLLCSAHDKRPPVCSGYPWYSRGPNLADALVIGERCSYLLDLPSAERPDGSRPLIPITDVTQITR